MSHEDISMESPEGAPPELARERQLLRAEAGAREAEQRYQAVFEAARDAMVIYTPEGVIVDANPAMSRMYGFAKEEVIGAKAPEVIHPDARASFAEFLKIAGAGGEYRGETVDRRKDGATFPIEVTGTSFLYNGRRHLMSVIRDITDRKKAEDALHAAKDEAERASRAKDEFMAILSHELRTPLTPVLLTLSLMERHPKLAEELREDVASIRSNIELESRLISDLLDLTRIEKGKLQLEMQAVDLHMLIKSAIAICQREASARLVVRLEAGRHFVEGDPTRLQQIFWNLINNAQKFTPAEGEITVRTADLPEGRICVEVTDTGAGIDPAVMPRLFAAFEQGDVRASRQQAGLGLGLAISQRLAEAHGGKITARSAGRGQGATFEVELPTVEVGEPVAEAARAPESPQAAGKLRVLLVEDHEPTLRIMVRLLSQLGHRVTGVTTVKAAVAVAGQEAFDLLISDLGLPDGSGLDLMRQAGERFGGRAIALTGYGMESDVAASLAAGFREHLTKPVDLEKLNAAIGRVAGRGES